MHLDKLYQKIYKNAEPVRTQIDLPQNPEIFLVGENKYK